MLTLVTFSSLTEKKTSLITKFQNQSNYQFHVFVKKNEFKMCPKTVSLDLRTALENFTRR